MDSRVVREPATPVLIMAGRDRCTGRRIRPRAARRARRTAREGNELQHRTERGGSAARPVPARQPVRAALLDRPVRLWLIFFVAVTAMAVAAKALAPELLSGPAGVGPLQVALQFVMLLMVLPFAAPVGRRRLGLARGGTLRGRAALAVLAFPALTVAFGCLAGLRDIAASMLVFALASVALAGVTEELAFRGVLLSRLLHRGVWPAVAISSALFGLMHLANLALGSPWYSVLLQVTFAAMAGTGYAAMRLRTGSLWPPMILHALFDLTFRVTALESGTLFFSAVQMLHGIGWLLYAIVVLRATEREQLARLL